MRASCLEHHQLAPGWTCSQCLREQGSPWRPYLVGPYLHPTTVQEEAYNHAHILWQWNRPLLWEVWMSLEAPVVGVELELQRKVWSFLGDNNVIRQKLEESLGPCFLFIKSCRKYLKSALKKYLHNWAVMLNVLPRDLHILLIPLKCPTIHAIPSSTHKRWKELIVQAHRVYCSCMAS